MERRAERGAVTKMTSGALSLRHTVAAYVAGTVPLQALVETHAQELYRSIADGDATAVDFAMEVELRLAEYSNGDWTESQLRRLLNAIRSTYFLHVDTSLRLETGANTSMEHVMPQPPVVSIAVGRGIETALA